MAAESKWKKGVSGNPSGRPKAAIVVAEIIRTKTKGGEDLVDLVLQIAQGKHDTITSERSRCWAIDWLSDRGLGKPMQTIELTPPSEAIPDMSGLSVEELRRIAADDPGTAAGEATGDDPGDGG